MKRITCIITAFLTFLLISINSLSVYALPPNLPHFSNSNVNEIDTFDNFESIGLLRYGYFILYYPEDDSYIFYTVLTTSSYLGSDYIYVEHDSFTNDYYLTPQNHLSSDTRFYCSSGFKPDINNIVSFSNLQYNCLTSSNNKFDNTNVSQRIGNNGCEIALSTVNIKYGDTVLFEANTDEFYSFIDFNLALPDRAVQLNPSETPTESPTIGEGEYDKVQAETSKNILENVKNIITAIANLPATIANNIKSFFTDLLSGIISGLNNLKDGIIQGLKDLFIPSDNAFTDIVDMVKTKFSFAYEFVDIAKTILVFSFDDDVEPPNFKMEDKSGKWFNTPLSIIDWTIYEPYRPYVHALILAIAWYQFIERTIKRLPSIIGGI